MARPGNGQIDVITDALRKDARIWDDEATETGRIHPKAEELRLNRIEAGLFQVIFDTYGDVIDQVIARSSEGQQRMTEIGSTLRTVAETYDRIDADNAQNLQNIN
ncbi:MAG: hypothetical protein ACRDRX_21535 [Pseudonocardiaceae bacterium]